MRVEHKEVYADGTLFVVSDDKGHIRPLSEPTLSHYIAQGKVENASIVRRHGGKPFVRLSSSTPVAEYDFPIPSVRLSEKGTLGEITAARLARLAGNGVAKTLVVFHFAYSNGDVASDVFVREGDVQGAKCAIKTMLLRTFYFNERDAERSASTASAWAVAGNATGTFKQIEKDPKTGFTISCKRVGAKSRKGK